MEVIMMMIETITIIHITIIKLKFMQNLLLRLFGHKPKTTVLKPTTKFKTTLPNNKLSLQEWVKEFNVGMMYDRKIIYMG